jgi:Raf kinase inhibitor-like YbhB/YbcL family protein
MEGERPAPPPPASRRNVMVLSSPAFENGEAIPLKHARAGENVSPPLVWTAAPPGARSFALAVVDVHPVARNYVHWLVAGLGPDVSSIAEGASGSHQMPPGSRELKAYVGPFPPSGSHDYEFRLYALETDALDLPGKVSLDLFTQVVERSSLATAVLVGRFTRAGTKPNRA